MFINDLDSDVIRSILKFADNTKVFSKVNQDQNRITVQEDLFQWMLSWQMLFNYKKCKVTHFGKKEPIIQVQHELAGVEVHEGGDRFRGSLHRRFQIRWTMHAGLQEDRQSSGGDQSSNHVQV